MRRFGVLALIAVLVLGLAVYFAACGGGGGSDNNNTVTFSSPSQAAASSDFVTGVLALSSVVGSAADTASGAIPTGYAPALRAKAVDTSTLTNIDPRLKTVVDKMMADLKNPTIAGALAKARSLKTASSAPSLSSSITVSTGCAGGGYYTISGSDTSTVSYTEDAITVAYYNCRDTALSSYDILSGSLQAYHKHMLDGSSDTANVTATSLSLASYNAGTLSSTDTLNGTFSKTDSVTSNATGTVTNGENDANGTFTTTDSSGTATFSITNFSDVWTLTTSTTSTIDEHVYNGSFSLDFSSGGSSVFALNIALKNLDDKISTYTADSSEDEWLNGTITMTWSPNSGGACIPGTLTITTIIPVHTPVGSCPTSGEVTVNNATIQFGYPSGTEVTVTVGGSSLQFGDCSQLGGSACIQ